MDLPEDIWYLIATHLTPEELRALIKVNRTFLHAALNARYRHVRFRSKSKKELYDFTRLQDPFIASRVRVLSLVPTCFLPYPSHTPGPGIITKFIQAAKYFIWSDNPRVIGFGTPYGVAQKFDHIFGNLKFLDEVGLFCRDTWAVSPTARTIVDSAWSSLGSNIHTLTLNMSSLALEQAVSSSLVFPKLEALTFNTYRSYLSTDADILQLLSTILLPFVTNHRPTLRLFVLFDQGINDFDFSPLLHGLGFFPFLNHIDASIALDKAAPSLWHFLGLHSNGLENLGLSHCRLVEPPSYDGPALAALKTLSLRLSVYTINFITSLQRGNSIKSLKLHSFTYQHSEVSRILDVFAGHQLRSLYIGLDLLSPPTMNLISESFPNLHTLFLRIGSFTALGANKGDSSQVLEYLFCELMGKKDYSHWQPPVFDLEVHKLSSTRCGDVLKKLFPQIRVEYFSVDCPILDLKLPW
ncbi:hypothetical protein BDZ94DRAFT_1261186 [Collybia nuda]|uniref:F-box domain-containing protein n=1 Tax=Collybia nuda TaxID=64659 RepID=A0A9P5Y5E8_9AGAR|nr:hypothetical protein BDZ94DRAFT_1261186 [Collybia nuda]